MATAGGDTGAAQRDGEVAGADKWSWPFDFEPYDIQKDLMAAVFDTLQAGHVGILESPTGTGKSLSLICSALHWLREARGKAVGMEASRPAAAADWIEAHHEAKRREEAEARQAQRHERVERERAERDKRRFASEAAKDGGATRGKKRGRAAAAAESDDEFAPSDGEGRERRMAMYYSSEEDDDPEDHEVDPAADDLQVRKVYFCSRTHSQLSQFMAEVRRTPFGKDLACVALGSRKQLCTNPRVRSLATPSQVNDACLELIDKARSEPRAARQGKRGRAGPEAGSASRLPGRSCCPMYDRALVGTLKDHVLDEASEIENIALLARKLKSCGYYASRAAVGEAELVALPYSMLLHKKTRESLGLSLKGNVVICDEAHNVIDAINDIHSTTLTLAQVEQAHAELLEYRDRYRARLKAENKVRIHALIAVAHGLCKFLASCCGGGGGGREGSEVISTGALMIAAGVDHINTFEIVTYVEESRLCRKLSGFADKYLRGAGEVALHPAPAAAASACGSRRVGAALPPAAQPPAQKRPRGSALRYVAAFLESLSNTDRDGKVLVERKGREARLKFLMLNPGVHFQEVVEEAHAVLLAGGTMQPTEDVVSQLFHTLDASQVTLFSCGHVIPKENMLCTCLAQGPTRRRIELSFAQRSLPATLDEIGRCLVNICAAVPGGVVVFLPSYSYSESAHAHWASTGALARLGAKKRVFRESREAGDTERMLADYAEACREGPGGVLLSIVGGKLSEGINFKDELARCVVMVGLPFPNPRDPELVAKMRYLDARGKGAEGAGKVRPSQAFYENQCMKAVNQCIGRAIRHREDYAAVVLLDARYARPSIASKLPRWMAADMQQPAAFGDFYKGLRAFFRGKES